MCQGRANWPAKRRLAFRGWNALRDISFSFDASFSLLLPLLPPRSRYNLLAGSKTRRAAIFAKSSLRDHGHGGVRLGKWVTRAGPTKLFSETRAEKSPGRSRFYSSNVRIADPGLGSVPVHPCFIIITRIGEGKIVCLGNIEKCEGMWVRRIWRIPPGQSVARICLAKALC